MGILQMAAITYDNLLLRSGSASEDEEVLAPVGHTIADAQIEVTVKIDGNFYGAEIVAKESPKIIIPVTESSASRSSGIAAHPLSDNLSYLTDINSERKSAYMNSLANWANSQFTHPKVKAIYNYLLKETLIDDLLSAAILKLDPNGRLNSKEKINGKEYGKCLVRWKVIPAEDGQFAEAYKDSSLFRAYQNYLTTNEQQEKGLCTLSGQIDAITQNHPKGVVAGSYGAKLISANDNAGFTYRGRFGDISQMGGIGYQASQKAHSALRWLVANDSKYMGGRNFLWWNPQGKALPKIDDFGNELEKTTDYKFYKQELYNTLSGYKNLLTAEDDIVVAALEAATPGRLSVTYYNELKATDFLSKVENWYSSLAFGQGRIYTPTLRKIISYALGKEMSQKGSTYFSCDDKILKEQFQILLHCMLEGQAIPICFSKELAAKATKQVVYDKSCRNDLMHTACSIIRKYYNDKLKREEYTLTIDEMKTDRSYLFGRLLAVAEHVERRTYSQDEGREPNAIRMQVIFAQKPLNSWRILEERLNPYYRRLSPGSRNFFRNLTQDIVEKLMIETTDTNDLNKSLASVYLLGYYHQRAALYKGKNKEENND